MSGATNRRAVQVSKADLAAASGLIVDYDQGKDARWTRFPSTEGGACFALAILWVRNTKAGVTLVAWLKPPVSACSAGVAANGTDADIVNQVADLMNSQRKLVLVNAKNREGATEASKANLPSVQDVFMTNVLAWAHAKATGQAGNAQLVKACSVATVAASIATRGGYCLLGFWIQGLGGHACAADCTGANVIVYFDPNWGVFQIARADFAAWLSAEFSNRYLKQILDTAGVIDM
jgi:hypothetical protein